MGCEMFETAKALTLAGLRAQGEERLEERLFLRFYGADFSESERDEILEQIQKRQTGPRPVTRDP
jgi:hypothetical protein